MRDVRPTCPLSELKQVCESACFISKRGGRTTSCFACQQLLDLCLFCLAAVWWSNCEYSLTGGLACEW